VTQGTPHDLPRTSRPLARPCVRVRTHAIHQVAVLEASGRLGEVVEDLDKAIRLVLAEGPRGVVCDLSDTLDATEAGVVETLSAAGRHVRDWPGIPVAMACPDLPAREALLACPLGGHLTVTESTFSALSAVLATPEVAVRWLRLAPHPTAPRAARDFVGRTLLDWRLGRVASFADMVVTELVASSIVNAGSEIDVSVSWDPGTLRWDLGALRLTVRDHGPGTPGQRPSPAGLHGRALTLVAGLSRAFGVLPTADGGQVIWAVLDAPRPSTRLYRR